MQQDFAVAGDQDDAGKPAGLGMLVDRIELPPNFAGDDFLVLSAGAIKASTTKCFVMAPMAFSSQLLPLDWEKPARVLLSAERLPIVRPALFNYGMRLFSPVNLSDLAGPFRSVGPLLVREEIMA